MADAQDGTVQYRIPGELGSPVERLMEGIRQRMGVVVWRSIVSSVASTALLRSHAPINPHPIRSPPPRGVGYRRRVGTRSQFPVVLFSTLLGLRPTRIAFFNVF